MGPAFDYLTMLEEQDSVSGGAESEVVSDEESGRSVRETLERFADNASVLLIEAGGRLIENKNRS